TCALPIYWLGAVVSCIYVCGTSAPPRPLVRPWRRSCVIPLARLLSAPWACSRSSGARPTSAPVWPRAAAERQAAAVLRRAAAALRRAEVRRRAAADPAGPCPRARAEAAVVVSSGVAAPRAAVEARRAAARPVVETGA